ncbi:MAG: GNAT family N-acetyltransferase, partial [Cyclobacteriaceae bacterium]|nr:GNAT family N-acetyltransferase [Cyclobacteriaceae bacterium]
AKGQIFISDNDKSCALILHPEKKMGAIKEMLLELKLAINSIGVIRSFKVLKREKLIKQNQPKEPFYYLWFIGVAPDAQGKGIGSALIEEVFQKYNKGTRLFYLETSVVKNLSWYEKYGFKIFKELDLGHKLYLMLRPKR